MLLAAKDQIRLATMEEAAASDKIAKDMALTADQKYYQDMTGAEPPQSRRDDVPQAPILPALRGGETLEIQPAKDPQKQAREEMDHLLDDLLQEEDQTMEPDQSPEEPAQAAQRPPLALMDISPT